MNTGTLVARHRPVVARGLALLGAKIFHSLVIEQRVDRLHVGVGVALVHLAAYADAPFSGTIGIDHVGSNGGQDYRDVTPIELPHEHGDDQRKLDDGRRQLQDDHAYDSLDAVAPALQHARKTASLAFKVEAHRELVQVHEGAIGQPAHGVHRHFGEQPIT